VAETRGYLAGSALAEVRSFLEAPDAWSEKHGSKATDGGL
jgi:hypothetical protein